MGYIPTFYLLKVVSTFLHIRLWGSGLSRGAKERAASIAPACCSWGPLVLQLFLKHGFEINIQLVVGSRQK